MSNLSYKLRKSNSTHTPSPLIALELIVHHSASQTSTSDSIDNSKIFGQINERWVVPESGLLRLLSKKNNSGC